MRRQLDAARRDPMSGLPGRPELLAYTDRLLHTRRRADLHLMLLDGNGARCLMRRSNAVRNVQSIDCTEGTRQLAVVRLM
ncbi:hypothetical protein [Streptomyces sp. NPDC047453]|uniref:hypothetical protein n=1 Tax=Streptomyces sp. NPDC047453 TaxID=3154812 RepID=UPI0033C04546